MHELGHTLGLHHGGQDSENYKPNYLSVMNYSYDMPWFKITNQGTNAKEVWRLDYSRSALMTLDENQLVALEKLLLNDEVYAALWLRYAEDMSVRDISAILERSVSWTKVNLLRARRQLDADLNSEASSNKSNAYG